MNDFRQRITDQVVCELTTCTLTLPLTDQDDVLVPKVQLSTVTLTLYPAGVPGTYINSRSAQTILDANGGTVATDGILTLVLGNLDNALVSQDSAQEFHVVLIRYTWASGTRHGAKEITYRVVNQAQLA